MSLEKILEAYERLAENYDRLIDHKPHNAHYDRPNTLDLMGDVTGMQILDAACGPGKYAEVLTARGASVTGFDISPKMVELAKQRNDGKIDFFVHDLSAPFDMLTDESFDRVLCALALHYIPDWNNTIAEFHRVLKPGGKVVISIEHPFHEYLYFKSEQYFQKELVHATWGGFGKKIKMPSFRRSLGDCITPFTENGFLIEQLKEPKPNDHFKEADPEHYEELMAFPIFLCLKAVKI